MRSHIFLFASALIPASAIAGNDLVLSCSEARVFLPAMASLNEQGYPLSRALEKMNQDNKFSKAEKRQLEKTVSSLYRNNLSQAEARVAAEMYYCK